ncbi:glutamine amidotransferase DUG3 [Lecanosticta acicola]|uniref:Glutamine amidotransferase DUG3 n=1 Tax=Lecanosticta acicola TaxID=111012 RepID=A0AAI9E7T6_9PEZI|nr:glutamine amidotransferase DUG3 [Lecanosticta acicola]
MCRWFAYISPTEPCLLEDVLISPKHSLTKQVSDHYLPKLLPHEHDANSENDVKARNIVNNFDGLGVAWYTSSNADFERGKTGESSDGLQKEGLRPAMYKTIQPPSNDMNFLSICANTETRVCFGHIRASSGSAITPINNHPFVFGRHTFMHNGAVSDFLDIKRDVVNEMSREVYPHVLGGTDSEHIAGLYMTYLTSSSTSKTPFEELYPIQAMAASLHKTVATVLAFQQLRLGAHKKPNSLNLCVTDGVHLLAYRFRNHRTSQPPSLYYSTKAGTTLNRKYRDSPDGIDAPQREVGIPEELHGKHLIVASEPSTYKEEDWELIGKNQILISGPDGVFTVEDVPYGQGWDAEG